MNRDTRPTREDLTAAHWFKAAASGGNGGCLEVCRDFPGWVAIRDSEDPANPPFVVTEHVWRCFLDGARKGEFDAAG
ncbi:DUF397 domain-containing protein [Streptomyces sp. SCUT-3]|uniref:DUF397 domain-containing protein n=1 Tax=Streptomyces sp. SCUT-3 TaxID=2684469 RepID=UPI000CC852F3|nr:DUF397 domain-containing protein [Streptomyces sp. SCUT-3]PLW74270.1 DUF397 domain-containing protein [Streptomyces sp. DJ]QMV21783.1 DUF397 domain-containing protein [Streptomyces sp. SCUT-3]